MGTLHISYFFILKNFLNQPLMVSIRLWSMVIISVTHTQLQNLHSGTPRCLCPQSLHILVIFFLLLKILGYLAQFYCEGCIRILKRLIQMQKQQ